MDKRGVGCFFCGGDLDAAEDVLREREALLNEIRELRTAVMALADMQERALDTRILTAAYRAVANNTRKPFSVEAVEQEAAERSGRIANALSRSEEP